MLHQPHCFLMGSCFYYDCLSCHVSETKYSLSLSSFLALILTGLTPFLPLRVILFYPNSLICLYESPNEPRTVDAFTLPYPSPSPQNSTVQESGDDFYSGAIWATFQPPTPHRSGEELSPLGAFLMTSLSGLFLLWTAPCFVVPWAWLTPQNETFITTVLSPWPCLPAVCFGGRILKLHVPLDCLCRAERAVPFQQPMAGLSFFPQSAGWRDEKNLI